MWKLNKENDNYENVYCIVINPFNFAFEKYL